MNGPRGRPRPGWFPAGVLVALLGLPAALSGQPGSAPAAPGPEGGSERAADSALVAFGDLAVGEWRDGTSRHLLEWTVGGRAIRSRSWSVEEDGTERLVSEGLWWADPAGSGAGGVRGVVVARDMGIDRFDYRSTVSGDTVRHALTTHGRMDGSFVEIWRFDAEGYGWSLHARGPGGAPVGEPVLEGRYRRLR